MGYFCNKGRAHGDDEPCDCTTTTAVYHKSYHGTGKKEDYHYKDRDPECEHCRKLKEQVDMNDQLVESVSIDLKRLSGIEFRKKYNKSKFDMRRQIASQPTARKHFGYAPTGNMGGKWSGSTSSGGNPARKDKVSGVRKALANKQPNAKTHKKGGIGGAGFGKGHIMNSYQHAFTLALDEFGVQHLAELNDVEVLDLINAVDTLVEFIDTDGNSYGPFWEEHKDFCQCEHTHHFDNEDQEGNKKSKAHPYGSVKATHTRKTPYGKFRVCDQCGTDHYSEYPKAE